MKGTAPAQRSWRRLHATAESSGAANKQARGRNRSLGGLPREPRLSCRGATSLLVGKQFPPLPVLAKEGRPGALRQPGAGAGASLPACVPGRPLGASEGGHPGAAGKPPPCGVVLGRRPLLQKCSLLSRFSVLLPLQFPCGASVAHGGSVCLPTGHGPKDGMQTPRLSCSSWPTRPQPVCVST